MDGDNVRHVEGLFTQRRNIATRQRKKGELPDHERPKALVIAHVITPEEKREPDTTETVRSTHPILMVADHSKAPEPETSQEFAPVSGSATGSCIPTTPVSVNTGTPEIQSTGKLAYANILRTMMEFEQARAVLHKSSDGMSPAIPLLAEVYTDLMNLLPKIQP